MKKMIIGVFLIPIMLLMVVGFFFFSLLEKEKSPNNGGGDVPVLGGLVCRNGAAKAEELKPHLKNAFAGHEQDFINAANKNGIDVILLLSIAQHETGYGNSNAVKNYNNPGGVMDWENAMKTIRRFPSLAEGIDFMARNLYKNYISQGLITIDKIGPKYAPVGAANDPFSQNQYWIPTVTSIANTMGGISGNCQETGGIVGGNTSQMGMQMPIQNPRVTSWYGQRDIDFHKGIDFGAPQGTPITAAAEGTVEVSGFGASGSGYGGYGNFVVINHGNGYWTLYGHMSEITTKTGDRVQRGQVIGKVGNTGMSFGAHLHFEVKKSVKFGQVDPKPFLPF